MTPPDENKEGQPAELSSGLNEIFGKKPHEAADTPAARDADGLDAVDEVNVAEMQAESPAVSEATQTALEEPTPERVEVTAQVAPAPQAPVEPVPGAEKAPEPAPPVAAESPAPVVTPEPVAPPASSGISNDLEEVVYASSTPTSTAQAFTEGQEVDGYRLNDDLGRGWFSAQKVASGVVQDVFVRPDPLWAGIAPHRLLPKVTKAGALHAVEPLAGPPLSLPLPETQARAYLTDMARLLFALEKQGFAVTDLDPQGFLQTGQGVKLRFPPRLARLGQAVEPTLREGFTPPEVQAGLPANAKSGVYLLGAVLYGWLTGRPLPPEGPSAVTVAGVNARGMPQLMQMMLADADRRISPTELLEYLKMQASNEIAQYAIAGGTNIGLNPERPTNEDSYGFTQRQVEAHGAPLQAIRAVVSDGMGGMAAGEVASRAAVQAFLNSTQATLPDMVWEANAAVVAAMDGKDGGCTITGVEITGTQMLMGHVGDTRAYLASGGQVTQLSKDHSYVAAMVASGQMTPEQAQHSPDRNKVLRSLGSLRVPQDNYVQTLETPLELKVGDRVLLVSDGVWGEVEPPTLADVLLHEPDLRKLVDTLLNLSLKSGAPDNITALVIQRVK